MDRRAKILSFSEALTRRELQQALNGRGCEIHAKMRMADALQIDQSGLSTAEYTYALRAHFDFVISRRNKALFAIEFDDDTHWKNSRVMQRDRGKESICEALGMPLLRIDHPTLTTQFDQFRVIAWLSDLWFDHETLQNLQASGHLPPDEVFDPRDAIKVVNGKVSFPRDPLPAFACGFHELHARRVCRTLVPLHLCWHDTEHGGACAIVMAEVHPETGKSGIILGTGHCRAFNFGPVLDTDLADLFAFDSALERLRRFEEGRYRPLTLERAKRLFDEWRVPATTFEILGPGNYRLSIDFRNAHAPSGGGSVR